MFWKLISGLTAGKSVARVLMNESFRGISLSGQVVDVGGGRRPDYFLYFDTKKVVSVTPLDGSMSNIDFEKDALPYSDASVDTVVMCNILEHVYNHQFLVDQSYRILKRDGILVGFVPFLVNYHPDPHDFFRYTSEALRTIFQRAGYRDIEIIPIGGSALYVNYNNIVLSLPRYIRPIMFIPYYFANAFFLMLRPQVAKRYPLGYTFYAKKIA